ncbi:hypothetical protein CAPTEDRAFT_108624, partial [Capitella teleta]
KLSELLTDDMAAVDQVILDLAGAHVELIPKISRHLISSGGKRLRPLLTLAAARLAGYEGDQHVTMAASIEFMHTATLLHDDVVDESGLRRGNLTARLLWGNQAAVLVGDYLLGQAFRMMVSVGEIEALRCLSDAAAAIAEGEVMQLSHKNYLACTEDSYFQVIEAKTAKLFIAACEVGAIMAGLEPELKLRLAAFGRHLGLAFQISDDLLDYTPESGIGKLVGDDFREGKITLPVILAYEKGDAEARSFWEKAFAMEEDERIGELDQAVHKIKVSGAAARCQDYADQQAKEAVAALSYWPDTELKEALLETARFAAARSRSKSVVDA